MGISENDGAQSVLEETKGCSLDDTVVMVGNVGRDFNDVSLDILRRRVVEYRVRADEDFSVPNYSWERVGSYKIISAMDSFGRRTVLPGLIRGRFVDVVAYAVRQEEFYVDFGFGRDEGSSNNGYVVGVDFGADDIIPVERLDCL